MNTYHLILQTPAQLPARHMICLAARDAHRQQGTCPPIWRSFKLYQYLRRQSALQWLLAAVAHSLHGHCTVGSYLGDLLPFKSADDYLSNLLRVRTAYLQDLLNHTEEDNPTLNFEDYLPTPPTQERKPCDATTNEGQLACPRKRRHLLQ